MQHMGVLGLAALLLATAACQQPTASDDALADFEPPTLAKRDEVRQLLEKRFAERDVDGDGRLTKMELGNARADRIARADTDQDGAISRSEFVARGLARFDRADANHDGMVTNKEQDAARAADGATATPAQTRAQ
ncbi:calcium-binding protein [Sphingomonas sp. TREG-RG-20F-R18-01]|uniref:calcium-binding protein n=1 Tax=Sphingomonas sp. TREG-RG-20F-R18-01 TaxID=2914982 RepID=UPI001F569BBA|nr:calcium-binding protein [Sphingomonas sp. TREG-RG-20F-R18-01]